MAGVAFFSRPLLPSDGCVRVTPLRLMRAPRLGKKEAPGDGRGPVISAEMTDPPFPASRLPACLQPPRPDNSAKCHPTEAEISSWQSPWQRSDTGEEREDQPFSEVAGTAETPALLDLSPIGMTASLQRSKTRATTQQGLLRELKNEMTNMSSESI